MTVRASLLKAILFVAQASPVLLIFEYIAFRTSFAFVAALLSIGMLIFSRCRHCHTSFQNPRIYEKLHVLKFWDTRIVDQCPICGHSMD